MDVLRASIVALLLVAGCGSPQIRWMEQVGTKASYSLDCPVESIDLVAYPDDLYEVVGCDKWAAFQCRHSTCDPVAEVRPSDEAGVPSRTVHRLAEVHASLDAVRARVTECTSGRSVGVTVQVDDGGHASGVSAPQGTTRCIYDALRSSSLAAGQGTARVHHRFGGSEGPQAGASE